VRRIVRISLPVAAALCLVGSVVHAGTPVEVVDSTAYEFGSATGGDFLAWSRGPTISGDYDLYVKQSGQAADVRGAARYQDVGNIELGHPTYGDVLVYSIHPAGAHSNIRFYDLSTGAVSSPPAGVNTTKDEDNPAIGGDFLLFGRGPANRSVSKRVILYDLTTTDRIVVATAPSGGTVTANSVEGDYASYTVCPMTGRCNVFRYRISTGRKVKMPNPDRANYWSSVLADGTVYFVQGSPIHCGVHTKIRRFRSGSVSTLYAFPRGIEVADLDAVDVLGGPIVQFTRINCPNNYASGIWEIDG
jgi:hypothetical protein